MTATVMPSGYCFELTGDSTDAPTEWWMIAPDDDWDTEVYSPKGAEQKAGERFIDGTRCVVFACPDDVFRAVNKVNVR